MKKLGLKVLLFSLFGLFGFATIGINSVNAEVTQNSLKFGDNSATGIGVAGTTGTGQTDSLVVIIKNFINWVLGILGLIALIVLLRGGFQMVTAAGDEEKYKSGFKILKQAAIGLAFIGVSFFVVSMIFFVLSAVGGGTASEG